jgi:2-C-methyl-D-erythritol 4-phosphate cytidylyltransferase
MRYWLVMPAAGAGRRFGGALPKQYAQLLERSVIEWALAPFLVDRRCAEAVVALSPDDRHWARIAPRLQAMKAQQGSTGLPAVGVVTGGEQRSHSVRAALASLEIRARADDWVLVHDAVRPCLDVSDLERLLGALAAEPLGGLLAVPVADTFKRAAPPAVPAAAPAVTNAPTTVAQTIERAGLWRALTPQMFRYGRLCAALDAAHAEGRSPTDEAQALEWQGGQPLLIEGAASNIKVTTAADLELAAALLEARRTRAANAAPDAFEAQERP